MDSKRIGEEREREKEKEEGRFHEALIKRWESLVMPYLMLLEKFRTAVKENIRLYAVAGTILGILLLVIIIKNNLGM